MSITTRTRRRLLLVVAIFWGGLLAGAFMAGAAFGAVETTTIQGNVINPNGGSVTAGSLRCTLSASGTAMDPNSAVVVAGRIKSTIDPNGYVSIVLVPNDAITPSGTFYTCLYDVTAPRANRGSWQQLWSVTTAPDPIDIGAVVRLDSGSTLNPSILALKEGGVVEVSGAVAIDYDPNDFDLTPASTTGGLALSGTYHGWVFNPALTTLTAPGLSAYAWNGGAPTPDLILGNGDEGILRLGNFYLGVADEVSSGTDFSGVVISYNTDPNLPEGISHVWMGPAGVPRFVLAVEGADYATYNPRSFLIGPAATMGNVDENVLCSTIHSNIDCDTGGTGADLGVQDDVEIGGTLFTDEGVVVAGEGAILTFNEARVNGTGDFYPRARLFRGRGTMASPTPTGSGDVLGRIGFGGWWGSGAGLRSIQSYIQAVSTELWTGSAAGEDLEFYTTGTGTVTARLRFTIPADGPTDDTLLIGSAFPSSWIETAWPDCNAFGKATNYETSTNTISCRDIFELKWAIDPNAGGFYPLAADSYDLGTSALPARNLYVNRIILGGSLVGDGLGFLVNAVNSDCDPAQSPADIWMEGSGAAPGIRVCQDGVESELYEPPDLLVKDELTIGTLGQTGGSDRINFMRLGSGTPACDPNGQENWLHLKGGITPAGFDTCINGTVADLVPATVLVDSFCANITDPVAGDVLLWRNAHSTSITWTGIDCLVRGGTNAIVSLEECNGDAGSCVDSETDVTCGTTNSTESGAFTDATINPGDYVEIEVVSESGTPTLLAFCVTYSK